MGLGVARALAARPDVELVVLGSSAERGAAAVEQLSTLGAPERVSFVQCNLSRMADVPNAIDAIRADNAPLDAIFINAGIGYAPKHVVTEDGFDSHFQVNYLAQFLLTLNLLDLLERSEHGGRVVFNATEFGEMGWDDLQMEQSWSYEAAIFQAMAAKRLLFAQLHALYAERDAKVACFGFRIKETVWTNQIAIIPWYMRAMATMAKWFGQFISIDECGAMIAPLLVEDAEASASRSGRLVTWEDGEFRDFEATPADPGDRERLWQLSLELCGDEQTRTLAGRLAS
jgi:NAD(P)-dependent dehydrogenase (short-subunit alcohol dehydrogenase family)